MSAEGLPEASRVSYDNLKIALTQMLEHMSKREFYNIVMQVQVKSTVKGGPIFKKSCAALWTNGAQTWRQMLMNNWLLATTLASFITPKYSLQ